MDYLALVLPNHNRVYRDQAPVLAVEELTVLNRAVLDNKLSQIRSGTVAGMDCLEFSGPSLSSTELAYIGALSFCYGSFSREGELLKPLALPRPRYFDEDLLSILKYSGKTNEAFTALLYNVTLWSGAYAQDYLNRLRVLDPLCGRGTTLYYALYRGHDADGIEVAKADVQVIDVFLSRYLQEHRYKHEFQRGRISRPQGGSGRRFSVHGAREKESLKANPFTVNVFNDDTVNVNSHFAKNTYHALVADLPYGVQHGGSGSGRGHIGADKLLNRALPGWIKVLKQGGSIGLSWNANSLERQIIIDELEAAGLSVLKDLGTFRHRVDQAVVRDLVVALKP